MYHHSLRMVIFSPDKLLEREIGRLEPMEHFDHEIVALDEFAPEALAGAEVVIIDMAVPMSFSEVREAAGNGCFLTWCMSPEDEAALRDDDIACLNDVWLTPLRPPRIRLRMRNILSDIRRHYDARQHLIWLDTLIDSMPDLVWFKDLKGVHHKVNTSFCRFVGKKPEDIIGHTHCDIWNIPEEDREKGEFACRESENAAIASGTTYLTDEIVRSGEKKHLFKTFKTPIKSPDGHVLGTVGFAHDLTNLLNLGMELDIFIEAMPFPLIICDSSDNVVQLNSHFLSFFGLRRQDVLDRNYSSWKDGFFRMETSPINGESYIRFDAGTLGQRCITIAEKDIQDIFGNAIGGIKIFRDVTAEMELELHVWRTANTDALTGLANRHAFSEYLKGLSGGEVLHLFYIDLDNFKKVNDTWGHRTGDEALRILANALREIFPQDFQVRLGGDEFLICIRRHASAEELGQQAAELLDRLTGKFTSSEKLRGMSASIGIRAFGSMSEPMDSLIRQADMAMYRAKVSGKACYCFWDESIGKGD